MMKKENAAIVLSLVSIVALVGATLANELGGTSEDTGTPYQAPYSYCAQWSGGPMNHCIRWNAGVETRQDTIVHGWFWETTSYRVVR